jgi:ANTAR domain-containing protein/GAF domain-containing protein
MSATTLARAFADAARALVSEHDVAGTVTALLAACADLTSAEAAGVLIRSDDSGELDLLAATSHQATELELYQRQRDLGPGPDTIRTGAQLVAGSPRELVDRWGDVGEAIVAAGYAGVHSSPLRWQDHTFGALNAFQRAPGHLDENSLRVAQAFADLATVVIVNSTDLSRNGLDERIRVALESRVVIEQAKGVLADRHDVDMATAYHLLARLAEQEGSTLTSTATAVVRTASRHP